jgi:hypothetical protein
VSILFIYISFPDWFSHGLYVLFRPELREKEKEQKDAQLELQRMRENMERMEIEREEMVREVEAQIERALASMAVDVDDSDYGAIGSRPSSRLSSHSAPNPSLSRRGSDVGLRSSSSGRGLRSFSTDSTLVESFLMKENESMARVASGSGVKDTIVEADEESDPPVKPKPKRFSASHMQGTGVALDGMSAVDAGIHENSETIAQKMLEIQQKVCLSPILFVCYVFLICNFFHSWSMLSMWTTTASTTVAGLNHGAQVALVRVVTRTLRQGRPLLVAPGAQASRPSLQATLATRPTSQKRAASRVVVLTLLVRPALVAMVHQQHRPFLMKVPTPLSSPRIIFLVFLPNHARQQYKGTRFQLNVLPPTAYRLCELRPRPRMLSRGPNQVVRLP